MAAKQSATVETTSASLAGIGHNSGPEVDANKLAIDRLRSLVDRIERLNGEKKALSEDVRDIYQEAKSAGYDTAVLRQLIRIRARNPQKVEEEEQLLDVYRHALGM